MLLEVVRRLGSETSSREWRVGRCARRGGMQQIAWPETLAPGRVQVVL